MNAIQSRYTRGFSLIELLVVIAVIAVMTTMMIPAIKGFSSTTGRRGAVNTVMNTLEQSRVAALESGTPVYVLLWRRVFPEADSIMVIREKQDNSGQYEKLTKWIKLPKGIILHQPTVGSSALSAIKPSAFDIDPLKSMLPTLAAGEQINVLQFNEAGGLSYPTLKAERKIIISEGVRGSGGTEALISEQKQAAGGFEIISLSRYTGRSQLDVSTVQ